MRLLGKCSLRRPHVPLTPISPYLPPQVRLLGDGRRTRTDTPQERSAAVLADLARSGDNKLAIVEAGGVGPLVAMLVDGSREAQSAAAGAIWHLAALEPNKKVIYYAGAIVPLVALLSSGSTDAQTYSAGALWHLASSADSKAQMAEAGAIPPLVAVLRSPSAEAREHAAAVLSTLARGQVANKRAILKAAGLPPLIKLLTDPRVQSQQYAACALWGLAESEELNCAREMVEEHVIAPLIEMLQANHPSTRGFAAACLVSLCAQPEAQVGIKQVGGGEPLVKLARGQPSWLRSRAVEMLEMLGIPVPEPDDTPVTAAKGSPAGGAVTGANSNSPRMTFHSKTTFHVFSFQASNSSNWLREVRAQADRGW